MELKTTKMKDKLLCWLSIKGKHFAQDKHLYIYIAIEVVGWFFGKERVALGFPNHTLVRHQTGKQVVCMVLVSDLPHCQVQCQ